MNSPEDREDPREANSAPHRAPLAECRLDVTGLRFQRDRYRALGEHLADVQRARRRLDVRFENAVDETLQTETLAVEGECCPFFELDYNPTSRWLSIRVK